MCANENEDRQKNDENAKLQQETGQLKTENAIAEKAVKAYEKSVTDLRWSLGVIVTLALAAIGILVFKNTRDYRDALQDAKEASKESKEMANEVKEVAKEARGAVEKVRDWEQKAQETSQKIDTIVAQKLKEIEEQANAEREKTREEADKGRWISELSSKGIRAMDEGRYGESCSYWQEIIMIKPDSYEVWANFGFALLEQAEKKEGTEADRLFEQAYEKYRKAAEIEPNGIWVLRDWGIALSQQAKKKKGAEKERLLQGAREKYLKAEQIKKGGGAYNLAGIEAIAGNEDECKKWLKVGEETGELPTKEYAMKDEDLKVYRNKDWFKAIKWEGEK